ncbi:solute carrier family 41 member 1-like isoform X1 [Osmia bicornis bicornis]|uniref:solute carrier family 41 member 1-like isoform X1 n=1 Tax=Osmia bicornis bicornis TaxID=1437191 RepID=UPI0010F91D01|nr:solute carrier family 41 member 1-like isoform X1 [Osmia bicornis bicornis]XP_029041640.1 solute carrier family 41 member 1-like isoform X1 [Osmia bicornis bicornis]XP_029041641.1 solute carrier family 41 member 1-like isoform X1 [Osmia bicornis bicornis]XP_029041642.1 solute carrier family 41 member 1-like isoform X1 [Osmia bicornis bicornis]
MVAFPDSSTEPTLLNVTDIKLNDSMDQNERLANKENDRGVKDHAFTIERHNMSNGKDNYALDFDCSEKGNDKKLNTSVEIKAEPDLVKKVAAGLKSPNGQKNKTDMSPPNPGGGSLSSGSSLVTISSVENSDPDPDFRNNSNGFGNNVFRNERWYQTTLQVAVPFFIAGIGTIGAGLVQADIKDWPVFRAISQLFILVPPLLGLKGNLDMCLASRLSTQANLGNMHCFREITKMIIGNIALVQIQAIVAAILVSIFAIVVNAITEGSEYIFNWNNSLLLMASSVCTATSSCFILDFVMIAVIMISYRCKMNPDNLATPLAASFGDVVSITVLSRIASAFFERMTMQPWLLYVVIGCYLLILPFWIYVVLKNKYTRNVLTSGWVPVLSALCISGFGGLVLDQVIDEFEGFVIFQPIINGIGGNLVSVQASRISTTLHQTSIMGILPPHSKMFIAPWKALFKGSPYAKTARILVCMAIFGETIFIFVADYLRQGTSTVNAYFVISYVFVAVLQVMVLLYVAHIIIHAMWRYKIDPDNSAIPYLTALGDLSGTVFLALAFWFLITIHQQYGK